MTLLYPKGFGAMLAIFVIYRNPSICIDCFPSLEAYMAASGIMAVLLEAFMPDHAWVL